MKIPFPVGEGYFFALEQEQPFLYNYRKYVKEGCKMGVKDRGMKKWQGFFMTEHVEELQGVDYDSFIQDKPVLDEYQIAELESKIHFAMEYNLFLDITLWLDGDQIEKVIRVHHLDNIKKKIRGKGENGDIEIIDFENIIDVKVHD